MIEGIEFPWDPADFDTLLAFTRHDEALNIALGAIKGKEAKILEAGCGGGG